ncbi:uncharacterized protein METZ01_LOCUS225622 [marine metagenome]|uniref:Uncharacterized protein n=1 Tax=marine metagenome TaxID=408172 RepID=A0A382GBZ9_9ZZZZ
MAIPVIHVGCGPFSTQRLQLIIDEGLFTPVACVDIDRQVVESCISSLRGNVPVNLDKRIYKTIAEAKQDNEEAQACFIFASATAHAELIMESLSLGMHTFCVKTIACNQEEFSSIIAVKQSNEELMLVQGLNNQWNEASAKMQEWLRGESGIGRMLGGECLCWGRQNLKATPPQPDSRVEGMYFHALACHQLGQLVAAIGMPDYVTAYTHQRVEKELDFLGIWGTAGGQCLFEFPDGVPFSYVGTRAGHGNPFGFASRWSGQWTIHGDRGDLRREGGRLTLFRGGQSVEDYFLKDLDNGLIEDERLQFRAFYDAVTVGTNKQWMQDTSLNTWVLMEACNLSARNMEKVSVQELKLSLFGTNNNE